MRHFVMVCLASALMLFSAGGAAAAPKTCALGQGQYVCCKTFVLNHCPYRPCCEIGNAGFFTASECQVCLERRADGAAKASHDSACGEGSACSAAGSKAACAPDDPSVCGNSAFFTARGN